MNSATPVGEMPGNWLSEEIIKPILAGIGGIFDGVEMRKETKAIVTAIQKHQHPQALELARQADLAEVVFRAVAKAHDVEEQFKKNPQLMAGSPARQASLVIFEHYKLVPESDPIE